LSKESPSKYVRFIFNRITLEEPEIRAAAVGTLGKFGLQFAQLREEIA